MIKTTLVFFFVSAKERVHKIAKARVWMIMFILFMGMAVAIKVLGKLKFDGLLFARGSKLENRVSLTRCFVVKNCQVKLPLVHR